jgi:hypothetical protein
LSKDRAQKAPVFCAPVYVKGGRATHDEPVTNYISESDDEEEEDVHD